MNDEEYDINVFVPLFRTEEILDKLRVVFEVGWTGAGFRTVDFETAWCDRFNYANALFVNSATAALHLALQSMKETYGWDNRSEVISTPLTFVSTNHTIAHAGMTPIFADVDEYLCLDPDSVLERITPRTRAVVFVGIGGSTGQLERISDICAQRDIKLILDAAHMAGTRLNATDPGHLADAACFSFQAVKNLPTFDAGLLCVKDSKVHELARQLSWMGISKDTFSRSSHGTYAWRYDVEHLGFKYNGNSVAAVMALVGLKYLEDDNSLRRKIADHYHLAFRDLKNVREVPQPNSDESSRHLFQIRTDRRTSLIQHLHANGIYPGVHYITNTDYPMYRHLASTVPRACHYSDQILSLPLHLRLNAMDIDRIIEVVCHWDALCQ